MTRRIRRSLTADWPAPDRALWENGIAPRGLFESGGAGADGPSAPGAKRLAATAVGCRGLQPRGSSTPTWVPLIA